MRLGIASNRDEVVESTRDENSFTGEQEGSRFKASTVGSWVLLCIMGVTKIK